MSDVRVRTTENKANALAQYDDLKRQGGVIRSVVIAELASGDVQVLGQMLTPPEMGRLLMIAAHALTKADEHRKIARLVAHQEPVKRGTPNEAPTAPRSIKMDADGNLVPPPGENFISCGECHHPTFHVLLHNSGNTNSRIACAHCGNEIINRPIMRNA